MDKQVHFRIAPSDHASLIRAAQEEDVKVSTLMRRVLRRWLRSRSQEMPSGIGQPRTNSERSNYPFG